MAKAPKPIDAEKATQEFMRTQRKALNAQRDALVSQRGALDDQIIRIERQLAGFDAFNSAVDGTTRRRGRPKGTKSSARSKRGSTGKQIAKALTGSPGMTSAEIIQAIGAKDKSAMTKIRGALAYGLRARTLKRTSAGKYALSK